MVSPEFLGSLLPHSRLICENEGRHPRDIGLQPEQATRRDADDYVIESLQRVEEEISRLLTQVRNGIRKVEEDRLHGTSAPLSEPKAEPPAAPQKETAE